MKESTIFARVRENDFVDVNDENRATIKGVAFKTLFLTALTILSGVLTSIYVPSIFQSEEKLVTMIVVLFVSMLVALFAYMIGRFVESVSHIAGSIYALAEGISLGFITAIVEMYVPGVGYAAMGATLSIFLVVASLFATGIVKGGRKLFAISIALLLSAVLMSIITVVIALVGSYTEYLWASLIVEAIMLLFETIFLIFSFEEATMIVQGGCSKQAEWPVALGLMVTLVYIYIRVLRILLIVAELAGKNR